MIGLTSGVIGKRLNGALLKFVERELVAPTNTTCYFNVANLRCEPSSSCHMDYQAGDLTPSQACRLISTPIIEPYSGVQACSWNSRLLRCDQQGVCHPDVWRWARRGLRRYRWRAHKLYSLCRATLHAAGLSYTRALGINGVAAGKLVQGLAQDASLGVRRGVRSSKAVALFVTTRLGEHKRSLETRLAAWHKSALAPKLKNLTTRSLAHLERIRSHFLVGLRQRVHVFLVDTKHTMQQLSKLSAKERFEMVKCAMVKRVAQLGRATALLRAARARLHVPDRADVDGALQRTRGALVGALDRSLARAETAGRHAAHVLSEAWFGVGSRTIQLSTRAKLLVMSSFYSVAVTLSAASASLLPAVRKAAEKAVQRVHGSSVYLVVASRRVAERLQRQYAEVGAMCQRVLQQVEVELDSTAHHERVDVCVAIPAEQQTPVRPWKFYSPWSVKKTAKAIRGAILRQLMVD